MTTKEIIALQKNIGAEPDGFWGPKSVAACQKHLRKLMPNPSPWPKTDQASLTAFYGLPGDESMLVNLGVAGLGVCYDGRPVRTIRCHARVADSLLLVLQELHQTAPEILALYDGCYNDRAMRGSSTPSLHARGAAIDFDAANNANRSHWPTRATMPIKVMEAFSRQGWVSAGAFWSRDAMHFQASQ